jgi:hypothetical protein
MISVSLPCNFFVVVCRSGLFQKYIFLHTATTEKFLTWNTKNRYVSLVVKNTLRCYNGENRKKQQ